MTRAEALEELRRAAALVAPPESPSHRDRTGCLCVLSPRTVDWLIYELSDGERLDEGAVVVESKGEGA